jgi:pentapeptide MXKDX repeat protein
MTRSMSAVALSFALGSAVFSTGIARADDAMQAAPMMADCMKKAQMETDAMKKSDMMAKCKHDDSMRADPIKPDAMSSVPKK